jgi:DNA-binding MarR family transcriptional regulator
MTDKWQNAPVSRPSKGRGRQKVKTEPMHEKLGVRAELAAKHRKLLRRLHDVADDDGGRASAVGHALGMKPMSAATTLAHLRDAGFVERSGPRYQALWRLTDKGKRAIGADRSAAQAAAE